jgi:hypothetical protein
MSNGVEGCETRTYIGDTVIGGRTAQRILVNTILMHYMTNTLDTTNTVFHTSQDGGVIYAWDVLSSGTWDTLYWFTAVPGDRWYPPGADGLCPGQYPLGVLQVVDTGHVVLGGWSLRHVDVAFLDGAGQQSPDSFTIIERLGSPLMVIAPGGCIVSEAGGSLRTYDDNAFPPYNSGEPSTCDQFTGIDGPVSRPAFDVYPNPAHTMATLTMRFSEDPPSGRMATLLVLSAQGSLVRTVELPFSGGKALIDLHGLPPGLFTLRLENPQGRWSSAKLSVD